jgi:hypothetical protein
LIRTITILSALLFVPFLAQKPYEDRVQNSSVKVDFTYNSQIEKTADNKYKLTHFIKNNSSKYYLSVDWKDAGILCAGIHQLAPGDLAKRSGDIVDNPYHPFDSIIKYGVKLDYTAPARMYIKPQSKSAKSSFGPGESFGQQRETTFEVINADGFVVYSIQVISEINKSRDLSELIFRVDGGFSFALAIDTRQNTIPKGLDPAFGRGKALHELSFRDESLDPIVEDWTRTYDSSRKPSFFVINNPKSGPVDLVGKLTGDKKFTLKKVNFIAFIPGRRGFIGFTADIFLPQDIHAR